MMKRRSYTGAAADSFTHSRHLPDPLILSSSLHTFTGQYSSHFNETCLNVQPAEAMTPSTVEVDL